MKKKLAQINTVCNGSTGNIMHAIQQRAQVEGYDTVSYVGRRKIYKDLACKKYGNFFSFCFHVLIASVFDKQGYGSYFETKKLIKQLKIEQPDIIHLHNLHGYYLNSTLLFKYLLEEYTGNVVWTFHDCWPFTGHCAYYTAAKCIKWKQKCEKCPNKYEYPVSLLRDNSENNYLNKQRMFSSLKKLNIIVPSQWMKQQVNESFFKKYPIHVVNNGIDLEKFNYRICPKVYDKYHIDDNKKILLGVASVWDKRKGLDDFVELSKYLSNEYQIVLIGLNELQIMRLPKKIIGIKRTYDQSELIAFYSRASIFINPSTEETFSLVTVEAQACGTPVIVLDTSAVGELVNENNGVILHNHTVLDYIQAIEQIEKKELTRRQVRKTALKYNNSKMLDEIMEIYQQLESDV